MTELAAFLLQQPLMALAIGAILVSVLGGLLVGPLPWLGKSLRGLGTLGITAALLLTVAQAARNTTGSDFALAWAGMKEQQVAGGETRIPLAPDGHFWVTASVNGVERRFLVDTGATLTALAPSTAQAAAVESQPMARPVILQTANGPVGAQRVSIAELRFGNVVARDIDAVVAPGMGETNVIGMNLLSRLAGWRVENRTLILRPHHPQP